MKENKYMTIEEIISIPSFSALNISQDGKKVAYVKETADWDNNSYRNHVWIYEEENSKPYPITVKEIESTSPIWAPCSKRLGYIRTIEGKNQVFVKSLSTYRDIQVTSSKEGVNSFKWSNDGKGIYYTSNLPLPENIRQRREKYGEFQFAEKEYKQNCLCFVEIESTLNEDYDNNKMPIDIRDEVKVEAKCLVGNGEFYIREFDISPYGDKIAFTATTTPLMNDINTMDIYLFDINRNSLKQLNIDGIVKGKVIFSPDSKKICYTRTSRAREYYEYNKRDNTLEIYDIEANKGYQPLKSFDNSINPVSWVNDGILVSWKDRTSYVIGILSTDGKIRVLGDSDNTVTLYPSITHDGKHLAFTKATVSETFEVYLNNNKITKESSIYDGKTLSRKELVRWKNCHGLELEGAISLPHDFDSSKKYPLTVVLGGPLLIPTLDKWFPVEQLVEKGFIVFEPNKRGYFGYGPEYSDGDYKKLGIAYYEDVISGVDMLIDKGFIDKDKVGMMGFSEGGYTSIFCSLYGDRLKAVSALAASNDWRTFYISSSISYYAKQTLGDTPWNNSDVYEKTATTTYIKNAKTPTLILHKKEEPVEPLINAYEVYRALLDMKVDTELVIFEGTEHYSGEPGQDRAVMKLNLMWFEHYILNDSNEPINLSDNFN